jgi:hypothetical protein
MAYAGGSGCRVCSAESDTDYDEKLNVKKRLKVPNRAFRARQGAFLALF